MRCMSICKDGSKYYGEVYTPNPHSRRKSYIIDGIGCLVTPDGSLFEGRFLKGLPKYGRHITTEGEIFEGEFEKSQSSEISEISEDISQRE